MAAGSECVHSNASHLGDDNVFSALLQLVASAKLGQLVVVMCAHAANFWLQSWNCQESCGFDAVLLLAMSCCGSCRPLFTVVHVSTYRFVLFLNQKQYVTVASVNK